MAQISKEKLEKLKTLYKEIFDIALSDTEALEEGTNLVRMVELTHKPISDEDLQLISERNNMPAPF